MKGKAVSALRSKRGLRPVMRVAEPPVVGLTPQTTNEWKANTMKTYILRHSQPVEPQKPIRSPRQKNFAPKTASLRPSEIKPERLVGWTLNGNPKLFRPDRFLAIDRPGLIGVRPHSCDTHLLSQSCSSFCLDGLDDQTKDKISPTKTPTKLTKPQIIPTAPISSEGPHGPKLPACPRISSETTSPPKLIRSTRSIGLKNFICDFWPRQYGWR